MDLPLSEEQSRFAQSIRDFAAGELRSGAARRDETGEFPWPEVAKMAKVGLLGLIFPPAYGGQGRDCVSLALAVEELARVDAAVTLTLLGHMLCANHVAISGTPAQKERFLA